MHSSKVSMRVQSKDAKTHGGTQLGVVGRSKRGRRPVAERIIGNLGNVTVDVMNGTLVTRVHGISLIQAARDDLLDLVKTNLECYRQQINDVDVDGFTALHYAARYNRVTVVEVLLDAGANPDVKQCPDEVTPLHLACRYNSEAAIQQLLIRRATVNVSDVKGKTPLHYATRRGHEIAIKMLISVSSCNVNAADNDLTTPLIMSAIQGNAFICESLISRGADIEHRDINNMTALMWAAAEGHAQIITILLKSAQRRGKCAQKNYIKACDKDGNTALHLAVQNGSLEVVDILLSSGADVNSIKNNLSTPLHVAASNGFLDIAKMLVFRGAETDSRDVDQVTPMHRAALYNKVDILEFLHQQKGNINSKDKNNTLPIHYACWKGQKDAVEFLLNHGAQIAECDSSLRTALHWAVRFGHCETVRMLLKVQALHVPKLSSSNNYLLHTRLLNINLRDDIGLFALPSYDGKLNGVRSVLNYTDKNDQTALHYAAHTGNVMALKMLLEGGARTDIKDQEERSALHIAAEKDSVNCVEALILASNRETNDDDVDGRTPLLVACRNGHRQTVQKLLLLGGDLTVRDDERLTALMLAASRGHTGVMKLLLEHHASVNDIDKNKNTALHHACAGGHVKAVELLLEKKANVTLRNAYNLTSLDQAIDNQHNEVVVALLKNKSSCQACLSMRNADGKTALDRLIAKLPDAAMIVLDHSVERSVREDEERTITITFDYQYIDPGPDDLSSVKNRYFALNTMISYEREELLAHPLCQNILYQKWFRFGRILFFVNMLTYLGYLTCLTAYAIIKHPTLSASIREVTSNVELLLHNDTDIESVLDQHHLFMSAIFGRLVYGFIGLFFLRELMKMVNQKMKYLFSVYNIIVWVLIVTTLIFIHSFRKVLYSFQWQAGWIALFLAWINFIMYLRRIDMLGIYVIMFTNVLGSLLKVIVLFMMFAFAFASSFYIVMQDVRMFSLENVLLNVIVMTIGEFQFNDVFLQESLDPFDVDVRLLLVAFCFLMTIVLMNLTIGIAVGDIEKTHKNAYLKKIGLQVDLVYDIENNMPKFIQRAVHSKRAIMKPADRFSAGVHKVAWRLFASTGKVQFIHASAKDKVTSELEMLTDKLQYQQTSLQSMHMILQQRSMLLHGIATKLDTSSPDDSPASHRSSMVDSLQHLTRTHPNIKYPYATAIDVASSGLGGSERSGQLASRETTQLVTQWSNARSPLERLDSIRSTIV